MASIRHTARIRLDVVRSVHVAQFNGVHTTLNSGVVSIVHVAKRDGVHTIPRRGVVRALHVAKTRWCPFDTSFCRETRWRPYDPLCTFIRQSSSRGAHCARRESR